MPWEQEKGCTSFYLVVGVKESHKREVPFELSLAIKVGVGQGPSSEQTAGVKEERGGSAW